MTAIHERSWEAEIEANALIESLRLKNIELLAQIKDLSEDIDRLEKLLKAFFP